jgi:hypothetical protein
MRDMTTVTIDAEVHYLTTLLAPLQGERIGEFVEKAILNRANRLVTGSRLDQELLDLAAHVQRLSERVERGEQKARRARKRRG